MPQQNRKKKKYVEEKLHMLGCKNFFSQFPLIAFSLTLSFIICACVQLHWKGNQNMPQQIKVKVDLPDVLKKLNICTSLENASGIYHWISDGFIQETKEHRIFCEHAEKRWCLGVFNTYGSTQLCAPDHTLCSAASVLNTSDWTCYEMTHSTKGNAPDLDNRRAVNNIGSSVWQPFGSTDAPFIHIEDQEHSHAQEIYFSLTLFIVLLFVIIFLKDNRQFLGLTICALLLVYALWMLTTASPSKLLEVEFCRKTCNIYTRRLEKFMVRNGWEWNGAYIPLKKKGKHTIYWHEAKSSQIYCNVAKNTWCVSRFQRGIEKNKKFKYWMQICGPKDFGCKNSPADVIGWEFQQWELSQKYNKKNSFLLYDYQEVCSEIRLNPHHYNKNKGLTVKKCKALIPSDFGAPFVTNTPLNEQRENSSLIINYKEKVRKEFFMLLARIILAAIIFALSSSLCFCFMKDSALETEKKKVEQEKKYTKAKKEIQNEMKKMYAKREKLEADIRKVKFREKILENQIAAQAQARQNAKLLMDKELKKNEEENECVICKEHPSTHAVMPCGHLYYCKKCVKRIEVCAMCRAKVESSGKIFGAK